MDASERLSMRQARDYIERQLGVAPATVGTMHRWCERGFRGVRLSHVRVGRRRWTTRGDVDAFMDCCGFTATPKTEGTP